MDGQEADRHGRSVSTRTELNPTRAAGGRASRIAARTFALASPIPAPPMDSSPSPRTPSGAGALPAAALAVWVGALVAYLALPLRGLLVRVVPDDALFYLEIARNGAAGTFSSFDGLVRTNGYHPLWMLMLVPIAGATWFSRNSLARMERDWNKGAGARKRRSSAGGS